MRTKARELQANPQRSDDPRCVICHPKAGRVREDQVWGSCPTNRRHEHGSKGGGSVTKGLLARLAIWVAVLALLGAGTVLHQPAVHPVALAPLQLVDQCTPTGYCTGDDWDPLSGDSDNLGAFVTGTVPDSLDTSGGCDNENFAPEDCIYVHGPNGSRHVDYVIAQARNCDAQQCSAFYGRYVVVRCPPSGSCYLWLYSTLHTLPADGVKRGVKWANGGNGWTLPNNTALCAGMVDSIWARWITNVTFNPAVQGGACKRIHD